MQPARYFGNLILPGKTLTYHVSKPSESLGGRPVIVPAGRCVGGASSVNCGFNQLFFALCIQDLQVAMYTRAAASDYDDWESVYKNPGWGSGSLIPLLKKAKLCSVLHHLS